MFSMTRMTVGVRLGLGFALVILLLAASMTISINRLQSLGASVEDFAQGGFRSWSRAARSSRRCCKNARLMRNVLILDEEEKIKSAIADVSRNELTVKEALDPLEKLISGETERNLFQDVVAARAEYDPLEEKFLALAKKGDYSGAKDEMLGELRAAQEKYIGAVSAFIEYQAANSESRRARGAGEPEAGAHAAAGTHLHGRARGGPGGVPHHAQPHAPPRRRGRLRDVRREPGCRGRSRRGGEAQEGRQVEPPLFHQEHD
jgi:hypothetical protein